MGTVFVTSSLLLSVLLFIQYLEGRRAKGRYLSGLRDSLDTATEHTFVFVVSRWRKVALYIHRDIFLNGLHMLTYVALFTLRLAEKKLERVAHFLRTFKKKKGGRRKTSEKISMLVREKKEEKK